MPEVGKQLRNIRRSSGKTQAEVAGHLNLSRSTVVQMERGNRRVTAEDIKRLAVLYQCSPSVLLPGQQVDEADCDRNLLADLIQALPEICSDKERFMEIQRVVAISRMLTGIEARLGLDSCSLGPHTYTGGSGSEWEGCRCVFLRHLAEFMADHTLTSNAEPNDRPLLFLKVC